MRFTVGVSLVAVFLASCVVVRTTGETFQRLDRPGNGHAVIYIYAPRTGMPVLGQMATVVLLDDRAITSIDEGVFSRIEITPGRHRLSASTDTQMGCGGEFAPGRRYPYVEVDIAPGEILTFRFSSHPVRKATTCDRYLKQLDVEVAKHEMLGLREARNR